MSGRESSKNRAHLFSAVWALLTGLVLLAPGEMAEAPGWVDWIGAHGGDKVLHGLLFFVQSGLIARSLSLSGLTEKPGVVGVLATAAFGCALEAAQLGIPGRSATWGDLIANLSGAGLFLLAYEYKKHSQTNFSGDASADG